METQQSGGGSQGGLGDRDSGAGQPREQGGGGVLQPGHHQSAVVTGVEDQVVADLHTGPTVATLPPVAVHQVRHGLRSGGKLIVQPVTGAASIR